MNETPLGKKFREAVIKHDIAKKTTADALKAWELARFNEGIARRAESKAKRELLKEARGDSVVGSIEKKKATG